MKTSAAIRDADPYPGIHHILGEFEDVPYALPAIFSGRRCRWREALESGNFCGAR